MDLMNNHNNAKEYNTNTCTHTFTLTHAHKLIHTCLPKKQGNSLNCFKHYIACESLEKVGLMMLQDNSHAHIHVF